MRNIILACRALGLGTLTTTNHILHEDDVRAILGLPDDVFTFALDAVARGIASRGYQDTGSPSLASFILGQMCASPSHTRDRSRVPESGHRTGHRRGVQFRRSRLLNAGVNGQTGRRFEFVIGLTSPAVEYASSFRRRCPRDRRMFIHRGDGQPETVGRL